MIEVLGIMQARQWGACSVRRLFLRVCAAGRRAHRCGLQLNEFRSFMGLRRRSSCACAGGGGLTHKQRTARSRSGTRTRRSMYVRASLSFCDAGLSPARVSQKAAESLYHDIDHLELYVSVGG